MKLLNKQGCIQQQCSHQSQAQCQPEKNLSAATSLAVLHAKSVTLLTHLSRDLRASLPNRCLLCQQRIEQQGYAELFNGQVLTGVCQSCLVSGLYQTEVCLGCAKPLMQLQEYCGQCMASLPLKVIAPCSYHQGLGRLVSAIKYQRQIAALQVLAQQLAYRIQQLVKHGLIDLPQVIIPVPLHPNRLRQRGFNQAWLIAKQLSLMLDLPLDDRFIFRLQDTQPQAGLNGKQRRDNCHQAFALMASLESCLAPELVSSRSCYQHVALVDDVVTTGTTINEIATLLKQHNIASQAWCLARAEAPNLRD
ncbi:ComF family protein [Shewanella sp. OMA3-2]|uniref:ComF family protein n=1 Tax=Shewanella sp. OMA3-2 TaxID=2908650 RepID=UPI001F1E2659|nr:ComF family protein [Shewanella sp. OMA3-2]UJF22410.1 ComF family protein [Shewanella sp. OMA3-2]